MFARWRSLEYPVPVAITPSDVVDDGDLSKRITGQMLIAAGGFVGRFNRPSPEFLGYRDHHDNPPWSLAEIDGMLP